MFNALIVKPIFNLLVLIYALLPGHNFGMAIIVFTIVVRLLMWPLVKKQMHQTKIMREMQPELKRIKEASKGDRQKQQLMMMELYKERGISPFSPIGTLVIQLVVLIGLYSGLNNVVNNPSAIIDNTYGWIQNLSWIQTLAGDIGQFDNTLFGFVDLTRAALSPEGLYWPAMFLVAGSAIAQFFQSKQLMPNEQDAKGLRQILKEAGQGKQADTSETNAAVSRSMRYFIPGLIFIFTVRLPSALSLYWFCSGLVAFIQQDRALKRDQVEMEAMASNGSVSTKSGSKITIEGEVLPPKQSSSKKSTAKRKRKKK